MSNKIFPIVSNAAEPKENHIHNMKHIKHCHACITPWINTWLSHLSCNYSSNLSLSALHSWSLIFWSILLRKFAQALFELDVKNWEQLALAGPFLTLFRFLVFNHVSVALAVCLESLVLIQSKPLCQSQVCCRLKQIALSLAPFILPPILTRFPASAYELHLRRKMLPLPCFTVRNGCS